MTAFVSMWDTFVPKSFRLEIDPKRVTNAGMQIGSSIFTSSFTGILAGDKILPLFLSAFQFKAFTLCL